MEICRNKERIKNKEIKKFVVIEDVFRLPHIYLMLDAIFKPPQDYQSESPGVERRIHCVLTKE